METNLDFDVLEVLNPKVFYISDVSQYGFTPSGLKLQLKFPNLSKIYSTPLQYGELSKVSTSMLGFTDSVQPFPDGLYTVKISSGDCTLEKKIFRTVQLELDLLNSLKDIKIDNKDLLIKYNKINLYLHAAKSLVNDENLAVQMYKEAKYLIGDGVCEM